MTHNYPFAATIEAKKKTNESWRTFFLLPFRFLSCRFFTSRTEGTLTLCNEQACYTSCKPEKRLWDKDIQMSFDLANLIVVS